MVCPLHPLLDNGQGEPCPECIARFGVVPRWSGWPEVALANVLAGTSMAKRFYPVHVIHLDHKPETLAAMFPDRVVIFWHKGAPEVTVWASILHEAAHILALEDYSNGWHGSRFRSILINLIQAFHPDVPPAWCEVLPKLTEIEDWVENEPLPKEAQHWSPQ